jgi:hypothetical protein
MVARMRVGAGPRITLPGWGSGFPGCEGGVLGGGLGGGVGSGGGLHVKLCSSVLLDAGGGGAGVDFFCGGAFA